MKTVAETYKKIHDDTYSYLLWSGFGSDQSGRIGVIMAVKNTWSMYTRNKMAYTLDLILRDRALLNE